jgi:hypothetical protein
VRRIGAINRVSLDICSDSSHLFNSALISPLVLRTGAVSSRSLNSSQLRDFGSLRKLLWFMLYRLFGRLRESPTLLIPLSLRVRCIMFFTLAPPLPSHSEKIPLSSRPGRKRLLPVSFLLFATIRWVLSSPSEIGPK